MALRNLASYKVGKSYRFDIVIDKGITVLNQLSEVLEKGDKKLKLKFSNDKISNITWFSSDQLSVPKEKTPMLVKAIGKVIEISDKLKGEKPVVKIALPAKNMSEPELNFEKENLNEKQDSDNIDDHQYALRNVMRDLRWMLRHIGVECDKDELISVTLAKVKANLKNKGK